MQRPDGHQKHYACDSTAGRNICQAGVDTRQPDGPNQNSGDAPFHKRCIIRRDVCFSLSGSIKSVGKAKEIDIRPISTYEKEELIEPAFDNWFSNEPADALKKKGIMRMTYDGWVASKSKS